MATLNYGPIAHGSRSETYSDGSTIQYNFFPTATVAENNRIVKAQRAMDILDRLAAREPATGQCNAYFSTLGNGNTFSGLWQNSAVYVNFSPSVAIGFYAACHSNNRDLMVTAWCLDTQNRWMVAATLCHELAHAAGAPGSPSGPSSSWTAAQRTAAHQAELAASRCYFAPQYDSTILGSVDDLYRQLRSAYA